MASTPTQTAPSSSTAQFDLAEVSNILDALGRLFNTIWSKSPQLASFIVIMMVLLPYYAIYNRRTVGRKEKYLDDRVKKARKTKKRRAKSSSGVVGS